VVMRSEVEHYIVVYHEIEELMKDVALLLAVRGGPATGKRVVAGSHNGFVLWCGLQVQSELLD
jgi:hypothetical protein